MGKNKKLKKNVKHNSVVTVARIREINRIDDPNFNLSGLSLNPISRALNAISQVARDKGISNKPKVLARIGQQLNNLIPKGYEDCWDPPLTAKQLKKFLKDKNSVEFVRCYRPNSLGPVTLTDLATIAHALQQN